MRIRPLLALAALAALSWAAALPGAAAAGAAPRVLRVGSYQGIGGNYPTVRAALAAARPGDWILLGPGDYKAAPYGGQLAKADGGGPAPAGALITTPDIHLRGMNRNSVILDGTKAGSAPCSSRPADQVVTHSGANGVEVYRASGTWVENLTVCKPGG